MKIAVPTTTNNMVDSHFGHCEFFTVFTIENNNIVNSEIIKSPEGCGCKSNIVTVLSELGVSVMLAGNMGQGAVNVLNSNGIDVVRGCDGNITEVVNEFINGQINDSGETCHAHEHHDSEGQCEHNN
jgi:predicted Fe-Mo cluster-binding NifX family protein